MKYLLPLLTFLLVNTSWAAWPLVDRESDSVLASTSRLKRISKTWDKRHLEQGLVKNKVILQLETGKLRAKALIEELKKVEAVQESIQICLGTELCEETTLKNVVLYLRAKNKIDDLAGLIILAHLNQNKKQLSWLQKRNLDLPEYLLTLQSVERARLARGVTPAKTVLTAIKQRRTVKPWGKLSPRQELFLKYDLFEMKVMTQILEKTQKRIVAQNISIVIDYDGNGEADETLPVAPSERYRFAHKALKLELAQETLSQGFLPGKNVTGPHLLMAASELGYVDEKILAHLLEMPELKDPRSERGKLYLNALWTIGKAGLMAVPGGIYFVLPIVIVESYFQGKKANEKKNAPTYF